MNLYGTSVFLCIYMHRLQWSLIAKKSECLVDPISMLLSQLLSQLRPQLSSSSYMFEAIKMGITSSRKPGRTLDRENTWFCRPGRTMDPPPLHAECAGLTGHFATRLM